MNKDEQKPSQESGPSGESKPGTSQPNQSSWETGKAGEILAPPDALPPAAPGKDQP